MPKTIIGLEITEESVRAVEVTARRAPALVCGGEVPLPPGAARDSEIVDADAVAVALRQLWARAGIKGRHVVLGLGSRRMLVREHTMQAMRPDLRRRALPFQVQDVLPVPVDRAVIDFHPVAEDGGSVTGLLVAAVAETVEEVIATAGKAKLVVDRVDAVPMGLARAARVVADPDETSALIHIGDHTTYVVVVRAGQPIFVRVIAVDVATAAVRARGQRAVVVEEVRETVPAQPVRGRLGLASAPPAADPAVTELVGRLRSTLAFAAERHGAERIESVHVSGAGAAADGVLAGLIAAIGPRTQLLTAPDLLANADTGSVSDLPLNLVSTIGLVLGGVR